MFALLMLISHTFSDFVFQSRKMVEEKSKLKAIGFIKHGIILFLISIFTLLASDFSLLKTVIIITIVHLIIDIFKESFQKILKDLHSKGKIENRLFNSWKLAMFLIDQFLHIIIIIFISRGIEVNKGPVYDFVSPYIYDNNVFSNHNLKILFIITYIAFSGAYMIPLVFNLIYSNISDYNEKLGTIIKQDMKNEDERDFIDEVKTGKWIGILERILMLIFIAGSHMAALGVIVSVKSLARFKMMENKIFSEYYLLGTLLSVVYTITGYYLLNLIIPV